MGKGFPGAPPAHLVRETKMAISIIIRATNPSETAAFYRSLGVPFEADGRNADGFSALVAAEVVIERAAKARRRRGCA